MSSRILKYRLAPAVLWLACVTLMMAQVKTNTTETPGRSGKEVTVERGEVVYVAGNDVVIKMEDGQIRHVTVKEGATATVDGKQITIKDLKPGMKLERTITTTTTEKTVKTVRAGTGTVTQVSPPNWVTVRFEDNSVQRYKIPKGTTFTIDGQKKTAFELKPGMKISATRIIEEPVVVASTDVSGVTGSAPPPPPPPPLEGALLIAEKPTPLPAPTPATVTEPAAPSAPEPAPKKLPTTGSVVPLIGLMGLLFSGASFGLRLLRR